MINFKFFKTNKFLEPLISSMPKLGSNLSIILDKIDVNTPEQPNTIKIKRIRPHQISDNRKQT